MEHNNKFHPIYPCLQAVVTVNSFCSFIYDEWEFSLSGVYQVSRKFPEELSWCEKLLLLYFHYRHSREPFRKERALLASE